MLATVALTTGTLTLSLLSPAAPAAPATVRPGDTGAAVLKLQQRLRALHYDPGSVDGSYGDTTEAAVWAFQKVNRMRPDGTVDAAVWKALADPRSPRALKPRGPRNRVEISIRRQLLTVYRKGDVALVSHISTGSNRHYCDNGRCGFARTPTGNFRVIRRVKGWRRSPLGYMYKPLYFHGGYAMHGSLSVPRRPASHGCVRVPLETADLLARKVPNGTRVYVR